MDIINEEKFKITNDTVAEWALAKIKEAQEERDRLLALVKEKEAELSEKKNSIENKYEQETGYLKFCLSEYMSTVPCKSTKTQDTYQLLTGKLIRKKPATEYTVDSEKLLTWLKQTGREDFIKVESKPIWGELKKLLTGDPETGIACIAETGEIVEGVEANLTESKFDVKLG